MPRTVDVNLFRRGDLTVEELLAFQAEMKSVVDELNGIITAMKTRKMKSVYVDGIKKIPEGLKRIDHGVRNIKKGMIDSGV